MMSSPEGGREPQLEKGRFEIELTIDEVNLLVGTLTREFESVKEAIQLNLNIASEGSIDVEAAQNFQRTSSDNLILIETLRRKLLTKSESYATHS